MEVGAIAAAGAAFSSASEGCTYIWSLWWAGGLHVLNVVHSAGILPCVSCVALVGQASRCCCTATPHLVPRTLRQLLPTVFLAMTTASRRVGCSSR